MLLTSLQSVMRIASLLSIAGSICVLSKYFSNPILQRKPVNKIICFVAVCDFFFSLGTLIGRPKDNTWPCWVQSATTSYFSLVSIFWTNVIAFMLYQLVHHKHTEQTKCFQSWKVHGLCWIFPIMLTFAPLSTNTYGNPDADSGWCFLDIRHGQKRWTLYFWLIASFYIWIFLAAFLYVYMLWYIFTRLSQVYHIISEAQNRNESSVLARRIRSNVLKLSWYPIIIIVCWIPSAVYDLREAFNSDEDTFSTEADYINLLPVLKGFFTAVAFLSTTHVGSGTSGGAHVKKHEPSRMGDDSTEEDGDGSDTEGLQESLLHDRYLYLEDGKDEGSSGDGSSRVSTTSSQSLENSDSIYRENSDLHRCSLPDNSKQNDCSISIDSF